MCSSSMERLAIERDQLQASYNNLTRERDQLQTSYNNLTRERDQLENENDRLNTTNNILTKQRDKLQKQLSDETCCPQNWRKFGCSCYYISSSYKNWNDSSQDCKDKGAHLVIITSREEQQFINNLKKRAWIGLTDEEEEGTWKWVDGTPLTTANWAASQPDNYGRNEDCVEVHGSGRWNDLDCMVKRLWICEKEM
ncbi:asialoglycoprotein receptor 2-like [Polymixia lowei]